MGMGKLPVLVNMSRLLKLIYPGEMAGLSGSMMTSNYQI